MCPPLIYVAGAYAGNVSANIIKAEQVSISLIKNGWHVFTPHKNTAGYENYEDIPVSTWLDEDLNILARCDALYVMDNWRGSSGTKGEIDEAHRLWLPIFWEDIMLPDCEEMNVRWYERWL